MHVHKIVRVQLQPQLCPLDGSVVVIKRSKRRLITI